MIVNQDALLELYQAVKEDKYQSDVKSVLVLAATGDADSLCAVRILQARAPRSLPPLPVAACSRLASRRRRRRRGRRRRHALRCAPGSQSKRA